MWDLFSNLVVIKYRNNEIEILVHSAKYTNRTYEMYEDDLFDIRNENS